MNPWTLLVDLLGSVLAFFYQIIPVYGISIILLTITIGIVLFPLTLKQTRSMRAMQEIQPEVKKLQKELKGDREELNKQLMELYKERGVNPAAGCLPLVLQMPVWFALFSVLRNPAGAIPESSDLFDVVVPAQRLLEQMRDNGGVLLDGRFPRDASLPIIEEAVEAIFAPVKFLGMNLMINPSDAFSWFVTRGGFDLTGILPFLPYLLLIAVIVAAGFYQQVQTTRTRSSNGQAAAQSSQAESMQKAMRFMPILFGVFSWNFPTGLGLYWAASNVFRIGQQALIIRMDDSGGDDAPSAGTQSDGPDEAGGNGDQSRPSPNASKKKRRRRK